MEQLLVRGGRLLNEITALVENATEREVVELYYAVLVMLPVAMEDEPKLSFVKRIGVHKLMADILSGKKERILGNVVYRNALYDTAAVLFDPDFND